MNSLRQFYRELRRRQLFSVVALYAVAAWAVIEVGDMAIGSGFVTGLDTRNLFVLALIGLPLVFIAGWFYDVTAKGVYRTAPSDDDGSFNKSLGPRDFGLLALMIAVWAGAYVYLHTPPPLEKSIAVLPFENRGNDPDNVQFAFGIHDDLMTQLQRIRDLQLIAPPSVRAIDPNLPVRNVGLVLGAAYVMKGSVERVLDRIRVNVILLDASEERQTWAGSFDRELSAVDLFDIRDEITLAIAGELQTVLSPEDQSRIFDVPTTSLEASMHYSRGRELLTQRNRDDLEQAMSEFEAAVEIDPDYALAWAGIADTALLLFDVGAISLKEYGERQDRAVMRALALDDQAAEVWVAYGDSLFRGQAADEEQANAGRDAFKKAIELAPSYALAYHRLAHSLRGLKNTKRRLALYRKAIRLDPLTPVYRMNAASNLLTLGRDQEAEKIWTDVLIANPSYSGVYGDLASIQFNRGNVIKAIEWLNKGLEVAPDNGLLLAQLADYYLALEMWDRVADVRQLMTERLSPGNWRLPVLDFDVFTRRHEWPEAIALIDALPAYLSEHPYVTYLRGRVHFLMGELRDAGDYWASLKDWPVLGKASEGNCEFIQAMVATGDEVLGRELLGQALQYYEVTEPEVTGKEAQNPNFGICMLLDGRPDEALDFFARTIDGGWVYIWWDFELNPLFDPWRDDPRFIAVDQKVTAIISEQREQVLEAEKSENSSQIAN